MGLRDRGFVIDYYIPLFAGVDAAKRAGARTRFPFSLYAPYISGGGTGGAGGIGGGDGGFDTPVDFTISTPSITDPVIGTVDETTCDTVTSSAFESSNGQTHVASRWMIEKLNQDDDGIAINTATGMYVYDSGPTAVDLTSLVLAVLGLAPTESYRVTVRYKGSNGGWSDWSVARVFTMVDCDTLCDEGGGDDCDPEVGQFSTTIATLYTSGWVNDVQESCTAAVEALSAAGPNNWDHTTPTVSGSDGLYQCHWHNVFGTPQQVVINQQPCP